MSYKLGSLFDGSGGFPLSGTLCDIEPMWAAEVEPYPIAVTSSRFPNMKHLGDISKVNGAEIEPVDIITFGSPCQDLSVAGKRAGLKHEDNGDDETTRSGLFMEAVRIIKEMRGATNGKYPRFAVWENVPGAFSSNNGEDFRIVLQELIKITEPYAVMPEVPQKGWAYADCFRGDGWSLAYRVFDAQYWGVPQRRRRIYLVADFRGGCAEEILFEREGLRGYFTQSRTQGQTVTTDVERSIGADDRERTCYGISSYDSNSMKSDNPHSGVYEAETSRTLDGNGGNPSCNQGGIAIVENVPYTLKIRSGVSVDSYGKAAGKGALVQENLSATLGTSNDQYLFQPLNDVLALDRESYNCGYEFDRAPSVSENGINPTLISRGPSAVCYALPGVQPIGIDQYNGEMTGDKSATLGVNCGMSTGRNGVMTPESCIAFEPGASRRLGGYAWEGVAGTLRANMGDNQTAVAYGVDAYNQVLTGDKAKTLNSAASDADHVPCTIYEWHNQDSRITGPIDVACTLNTNAGGREGHLVMEPSCKSRRAKDKDDATTWKHADVANTLNTFDQGEARANELIVEGVSTAYSFDPGASRDVGVLFLEECGKTLTNGTCPGHHDGVVVARPIHSMTTGDYMQVNEEKTATLLARDYKDPTCVEFFDAKERRYIVRRLTPTECARLQGFPDSWGHIEPKTELTDDEYRFWLNVRKTHDAINGRAVKDYNEKQMLTYYNKLWTDSAEYKMWGNGIALPCALYVLQGIKDALVNEQAARSKWLDDLLNN